MAALLTTTGKSWTSFILPKYISTSAPLSARGVRHVIRGFNIPEEDVQDMDADDIEAVSSQDMEAMKHQSSQIEFYAKRFQSHKRKKTIEQKYFKDYKPKEDNLLTWAMKEQLRYLHSTDPDMWTPDALAKAFPISPAGAQKLLKVRWVMKNEAEIEKHDRAIAARWKKHTKGQLGSARLLQHTFDNRGNKETHPVPALGPDQILSTLETLKFHNDEEPYTKKAVRPKNKLPRAPKMRGGSFSSIIKDYELQASQLRENSNDKQQDSPSSSVSGSLDILKIISGTPKYEGTYTSVTFPAAHKPKENKKYKKGEKMMTFHEFIKNKTA
ncbi:uncharacterized protein LOC121871221 [Homarus americanus]|uniref:uncharacterized protein LOC121871221 n=1 Tax=Homarus americanus TaxID=6706 RepID=UPI001C43DFA8|nr:uncharacterized protein LOC121871221 [Homarus americanus]